MRAAMHTMQPDGTVELDGRTPVQAYTGAAVHNGGGPSHFPLTAPWVMADEVGALNFTIGLLMAVVHLQRTGQGA
jgi:crotonobetainyl-CoA:carnitine CoA-transferase CaiB-like acyl-CoA transferase